MASSPKKPCNRYIAPPARLREGGAQISPTYGLAITTVATPVLKLDRDHFDGQAASSSVAACCAPMCLNSQSAASCAWRAAVKMHRLSLRNACNQLDR